MFVKGSVPGEIVLVCGVDDVVTGGKFWRLPVRNRRHLVRCADQVERRN